MRRHNVPSHDDVIKWKHFPRCWPLVRGIHRSPVNSPHKGQWRGASMFSLICVWINCWVNNREAGDLKWYRAHYDIIVMITSFTLLHYCSTVQEIHKFTGFTANREGHTDMTFLDFFLSSVKCQIHCLSKIFRLRVMEVVHHCRWRTCAEMNHNFETMENFQADCCWLISWMLYSLLNQFIWVYKNTEIHTAHTIVSWPNPKQRVIVHKIYPTGIL